MIRKSHTGQPEHPSPRTGGPPRWADRLLEWFVAPHLLEYVQGDLHETFQKQVTLLGLSRARRNYVWAVLHCLTPFFAKRQATRSSRTENNPYPNLATTAMIRSYVKTAFRSLLRHRTYTLINVVGLTMGISIVLIISLIVRYETSFDDYHAKKERIYRVLTAYGTPMGPATHATGVPVPLPNAIGRDIPQFEKKAGILSVGNEPVAILAKDGSVDKRVKMRVFFTEPSFFDIFDFPWLDGSPTSSLSDPNSVVISDEMANTYFGSRQLAMGRSLKIADNYTLKISGILANTPANTDFQFSVIAPYRLLKYDQSGEWGTINSTHQCYVLVPSGASVSMFNRLLGGFAKKYRHPDDKTTHLLQPLNEVHYEDGRKYSGIFNYSGKTTSTARINTLWLIAAFILTIACVNFINLSTAQAVHRAKEVGVRKALGTNKIQLRIQFLSETGLLVTLSVGLAVGMTALVLPSINSLLDSPLSFQQLNRFEVVAALPMITLAVTLLAGFYPAVILSGFDPIIALKSRFIAKNTRGISLRKGLVVGQFVVAQCLIVGTLIIVKQLSFLEKSTMGFRPEAIVNVPFRSDSATLSHLDYLRQRLEAVKGIQQVSFSNRPPAAEDNDWTSLRYAASGKETEFPSIMRWIDADYVKTYKLTLVAGRNITANDSIREFLINETAVKDLGFAHAGQVLNKEITVGNGYAKGAIVGVVKDFHSASLKNAIHPVFMTNVKQGYSLAGIKLGSSDLPAVIASLQTIWGDLFPDTVFEYQFLDERIANFYRQEHQLAQLYELFASLAILLSCLGLYGLATFMAVQRVKEAGVRKVLGASVGSLVYLFSKEFVLLILLAFGISSPLAWWGMTTWLQAFVYKITLEWWLFVAAGLLTILIALCTVSYQAIKVALLDPVKSLRNE